MAGRRGIRNSMFEMVDPRGVATGHSTWRPVGPVPSDDGMTGRTPIQWALWSSQPEADAHKNPRPTRQPARHRLRPWTVPDSNRSPPQCECGALPNELTAHRLRHWWATRCECRVIPLYYGPVTRSVRPACPKIHLRDLQRTKRSSKL